MIKKPLKDLNKIKKNKPKKKRNKVELWAYIVSAIAFIALIGLIIFLIVMALLLKNKPQINLSDFEQQESSIVYDSKGEEVANLGNVIRQNVEYNEIPNCVVDAFVAIEDSRFFEHNGFDLPRFTKAFLENIVSMSFEQGGSTFTMQLVKNTYFTNDETGQEASRSGMSGIRRKVQEIALAMDLENSKAKQDIFVSYLNKLNFGGSNNIRGIQKASQYYFGKDVKDCNLVEGALLAGVINAPSAYNPFNDLQASQNRTSQVLYQMYNHGYISKDEYQLALSVKVEDLLSDPYKTNGEGEGIPYQAYVDQVVSEVMELTGKDPYSTTMHIYTYMNKGIQEQMDRIQAGDFRTKIIDETDEYYEEDDDEDAYLYYPDDYMEVASVCINNATGEIVGILGGRNYSKGGQLLLNHATEQYKQPGSTMKPILDYALAFENLGWATDHVLTDKPMWLDEVNQIMTYNDSGTYVGDVTLYQAVGNSINTCAVQTLDAVIGAKKFEYVINYAQSLGYDFTLDDFNLQYAIGGSSCEVTPLQHAGAYAAIMNLGTYNTPHTVARIEFVDGKSPITPTYESKQIISEDAAYLTTELMKSNVQSYGGTYSYVKNNDYTVYGKTGTTDFGKEAADFGIPSGSIKDGWLVAATSEYTTATWVGYEKIVQGQQSFIKKDYYYDQRPNGKIAHLILDACYKYGDNTPSDISKTSGVTSITHVLGTWPYATWTEGMSESLRSTGLIKADSVRLVSLPTPTVKDCTSGKVEIIGSDSSNAQLNITWPTYPDESALSVSGEEKDISLKSKATGEVIVAAKGKCLFDYTMLYGPIQYKADITITPTDGEAKTFHVSTSHNKATQLIGNIEDGGSISYSLYYGYENASFTSNKFSDKITVKQSENKKVYLPEAGTSADDIKVFCSKNSITYEEKDEDDEHSGGSFILTVNNKTYGPGQTAEYARTGSSPKITYYKSVSKGLRIKLPGTTENEFDVTVEYTNITSDKIDSFDWDVDGGTHTNDSKTGSKIKFDDESNSVTITLTVELTNGSTYSDSTTVTKAS